MHELTVTFYKNLRIISKQSILKKIKVKIGDSVRLFNGTIGVINQIDESVYKFSLTEPFTLWFHIRDIQELNYEIVDNEMLVF